MYELENISWSWLFLLIILISILFIFDRAWKIKTQKLFFSKSNLERLSPNISNLKPIIKIFFMIIGTSMFIIAMINPKIGTKIETFQRLGVDIVFAVDVSKSMLAEDIAPSRIEKSKQLVGQVINNLGGDRIGIVAYAGKAFPQLPLTTDYSSAKMFLQNMNTDMLSSQGTAIDEAIRLSSTYFDQDQSTERLLFIVSDGEDHNDLSYEMADLAAKNNITIYSIGVGTEKGSPIPIKKNGIVMSYKKDINGEVVITKLNKNYLENISDKTKGKYIDQVIRPTGLIDPPVEIKPAKNQVDDLMHECHKTIEKNYRVLVTTLTKKMAEDLTEYLHENGIKVRYLHSDIDTLERIEIMRDLRLGVFDVLVGINLLREGLDIPECALVGILDADKEGFLRSETSLIQTIGRAARNLDGKVILYADKETKSIKKAIKETERRRNIQLDYNKKNKISATTVKKEISDVLESVYEKDYVKIGTGANVGGNLKKHIKALNKKMKESATNLEFEEAAKIRDEIRKLESTELEVTLNPKVKQYSLNNKIYPKGRSTMGMPGTRAQKGKKKWKQIKS